MGAESHDDRGEPRLTRAAWATLVAALLGWLFDGFEMGLFPVVAPAALSDMLGLAANP